MSLNYEDLLNEGFSSQQVNQLLLLKDKIDYNLLSKINKEISVEYLRKANSILKNNTKIDKILLSKILISDFDPDLYHLLYSKKYPYESYKLLDKQQYFKDNGVKFNDIINFIKESPDSLEFLNDFIESCIDEHKDPFLIIKKGFNEKQSLYALRLSINRLDKYIDDIPKLNNFFMNFEVFKSMINLNMDYIYLINNYDYDKILALVEAEEKSLGTFSLLKDKEYDIYTFLDMVDEGLDKNLVDEILTKLDIDNYDPVFSDIIDIEFDGYKIHNYFDTVPNKYGIKIYKELVDLGYEDHNLKYYLDIIYNSYKDLTNNNFNITNELIQKYIELIDSKKDINSLNLYKYSYEEINTLFDTANILNINEKDFFKNNFPDYTIKLLNTAIEYNRIDILDALIHCKLSSNVCSDIKKILENDNNNSTYHNIINLLYDKGNDIFMDYNPDYEFNNSQKYTLTYLILNKGLTDKEINIIRDNTIDYSCMYVLGDMISDGYNIDHILAKIKDLSSYDLKSIYDCMQRGFSVILDKEPTKIKYDKLR